MERENKLKEIQEKLKTKMKKEEMKWKNRKHIVNNNIIIIEGERAVMKKELARYKEEAIKINKARSSSITKFLFNFYSHYKSQTNKTFEDINNIVSFYCNIHYPSRAYLLLKKLRQTYSHIHDFNSDYQNNVSYKNGNNQNIVKNNNSNNQHDQELLAINAISKNASHHYPQSATSIFDGNYSSLSGNIIQKEYLDVIEMCKNDGLEDLIKYIHSLEYSLVKSSFICDELRREFFFPNLSNADIIFRTSFQGFYTSVGDMWVEELKSLVKISIYVDETSFPDLGKVHHQNNQKSNRNAEEEFDKTKHTIAEGLPKAIFSLSVNRQPESSSLNPDSYFDQSMMDDEVEIHKTVVRIDDLSLIRKEFDLPYNIDQVVVEFIPDIFINALYFPEKTNENNLGYWKVIQSEIKISNFKAEFKGVTIMPPNSLMETIINVALSHIIPNLIENLLPPEFGHYLIAEFQRTKAENPRFDFLNLTMSLKIENCIPRSSFEKSFEECLQGIDEKKKSSNIVLSAIDEDSIPDLSSKRYRLKNKNVIENLLVLERLGLSKRGMKTLIESQKFLHSRNQIESEISSLASFIKYYHKAIIPLTASQRQELIIAWQDILDIFSMKLYQRERIVNFTALLRNIIKIDNKPIRLDMKMKVNLVLEMNSFFPVVKSFILSSSKISASKFGGIEFLLRQSPDDSNSREENSSVSSLENHSFVSNVLIPKAKAREYHSLSTIFSKIYNPDDKESELTSHLSAIREYISIFHEKFVQRMIFDFDVVCAGGEFRFLLQNLLCESPFPNQQFDFYGDQITTILKPNHDQFWPWKIKVSTKHNCTNWTISYGEDVSISANSSVSGLSFASNDQSHLDSSNETLGVDISTNSQIIKRSKRRSVESETTADISILMNDSSVYGSVKNELRCSLLAISSSLMFFNLNHIPLNCNCEIFEMKLSPSYSRDDPKLVAEVTPGYLFNNLFLRTKIEKIDVQGGNRAFFLYLLAWSNYLFNMLEDQKSQQYKQVFDRYLNYIYGLSKQFHITQAMKIQLDGKNYFGRQHKNNRFELKIENLDEIRPSIHTSFEVALFDLLQLVQQHI